VPQDDEPRRPYNGKDEGSNWEDQTNQGGKIRKIVNKIKGKGKK
jgi:hypothetical protein